MRRATAVLLGAVAVCALSVAWAVAHRPPPPPLPSLTVEVLNGCGVDGLAFAAATRLRRLGQDAVAVRDAPRSDHARTLLIDRRGRPWLTRRLARRIGPALVVLERVDEAPADVTLLLGSDYRRLRLFEEP